MDLVLGLSIAITAIAAFSIGYIYGKKKQADKDKADVFNAVYDLKDTIWKYCKSVESEDWVEGAKHIDKMYFDAIFKVFYGKKPNK